MSRFGNNEVLVYHQLPKSTACKMCSKFFPPRKKPSTQASQIPGHVRISNINAGQFRQRVVNSIAFTSLPYHHLIQENVLIPSEELEEALKSPFCLGPCEWTHVISSYSAATVTHQLAIATTLTITSGTTVAACPPMVCTYSLIRTVSITIPSIWSFTYHEGHRRRRIVPLWRLCTRIQTCNQ